MIYTKKEEKYYRGEGIVQNSKGKKQNLN
jgi:hypothetical protein